MTDTETQLWIAVMAANCHPVDYEDRKGYRETTRPEEGVGDAAEWADAAVDALRTRTETAPRCTNCRDGKAPPEVLCVDCGDPLPFKYTCKHCGQGFNLRPGQDMACPGCNRAHF